MADGAPAGLTVDRYDAWWVVTARVEIPAGEVAQWCDAVARRTDCRGVVCKTLHRPVRGDSSRLWAGDPPPPLLPIREHDVTVLCHLDDGISTGLFLDQRDVRLAARAYARDAEVLNLFAYTGVFSVHAARAGARRVTSVDASKHALARGRANMEASGLNPDAHRWFPDDVRTHLARAVRRSDRYALVILDPPMFGRAGRKVHALRQQLDELLSAAIAVTASAGVLIVSTHALELGASELHAALRTAASGRSMTVLAEHGLPAWDHVVADDTSDATSDRGDYLKSLIVRLG